MDFKTIKTGKWLENCYIVHSSSKNGLIIDPGGKYNEIIEYINKNNIKILAVINTHAHFDHIGAVAKLKNILQIPFYLHSNDNKLLKSANLYKTIFEGEQNITVPSVDYFIDDFTNPLNFKDIKVEMIETPGHTKGSICLRLGNCLLTGDTIFEKDVGRVDLPGGNKEQLIKSLRIISALPTSLKLYPGHGNSTTLGEIMKKNKKLMALL